jgi:hypothetical protein
LDLLTIDMFSAVDNLADSFSSDLSHFAAIGTTQWHDLLKKYISDLSLILQDGLAKSKSVTGDHAEVKRRFSIKLEWITFDHREFYYAPLLPLITPKFLDCIAQVFHLVPNALLEVSIIFPTRILHYSPGQFSPPVPLMGLSPRSVFCK